jgi:hypothetical protein
MPSNRQGATAPMEKRDGIETRSQLETCSHAVGQGVGLAAASLISYALITHILTRVYSVSREDDLVGGCGSLSLRSLSIAKATRRA